jgi:uncharacterized protein YbjT (DUF2867 family)
VSTLWIAGGSDALVDATRRAAEARGGVVRRLAAGDRPVAGDALLDAGPEPRDWPEAEALASHEEARVRNLAGLLPGGARVVRLSMLHAAADAPSALQRAHAAAEDAWRRAGADLVVLRHGVVLGPAGLFAAWRRLVERVPLVPVPGFDSRLEPILLDDLAAYCAQAAEPARRVDPVYDLGCGDMVTHGLLVAALARELGRARAVVPAPGFLRRPVAAALACADLPAPAARGILDALARSLLPRRMSAWDHFDVRPGGLEEGLARSLGRPWAAPPRRPDEPFGSWRRNRKRPRPFLR